MALVCILHVKVCQKSSSYLQNMTKAPAKFQNGWKTNVEVVHTRYLLSKRGQRAPLSKKVGQKYVCLGLCVCRDFYFFKHRNQLLKLEIFRLLTVHTNPFVYFILQLNGKCCRP